MLLFEPVLGIQAFGCSRRGFTHSASGPSQPCQDSYFVGSGATVGNPYILIATADGHGSVQHDLSHVGSRLAVEAAAWCFAEFSEECVGKTPSETVSLFKDSYPRNVTRRWRAYVLEHHRSDNGGDQQSDDMSLIYTRYGSTLLVAGVVNQTLLLAGLGDGEIVVLHRGSEQIESLLAGDATLVGGATYSLCSPDPARLMQTYSRQLSGVRAVTLSTDGLRNAYETDEDFEALLSAVVSNLDNYGLHVGAEIVPEYLDRFSEKGSGDDISLVVLNMGEHSPSHADSAKVDDGNNRSVVETEDASQAESNQPPTSADLPPEEVGETMRGADVSKESPST